MVVGYARMSQVMVELSPSLLTLLIEASSLQTNRVLDANGLLDATHRNWPTSQPVFQSVWTCPFLRSFLVRSDQPSAKLALPMRQPLTQIGLRAGVWPGAPSRLDPRRPSVRGYPFSHTPIFWLEGIHFRLSLALTS
mmetsp:Transcript_15873/g.44899  ORF Transcript_15873/g.44899 Transcript_15873/m.44899 type:complete len:137 (+) Transcript_15873:139-549(+)